MYNEQRIINDLKRHEGVVYEIYLDPLGFKTFGVGHLIKDGDPEWGQPIGTSVLPARVNQALKEDLAIAIEDCEILFKFEEWTDWPDEVREVCINMAFNLGYNKFKKFVKMKEALYKRDWKEAAKEGRDSLWFQQVGKRGKELMNILEHITWGQ